MPNNLENFYSNLVDTQSEKETEVELASPWNRIAAYIINTLLTSIVVTPGIIILIIEMIRSKSIGYNLIGPVLCIMIPLTIYGIWQIILMSKKGQSLGKRMMNIKVIGMDGRNPGFIGTVLLREMVFNMIVTIVSLILTFIFVGLLNFPKTLTSNFFEYLTPFILLVMLFRKKTLHRTLQDYLARTIVIKVNN